MKKTHNGAILGLVTALLASSLTLALPTSPPSAVAGDPRPEDLIAVESGTLAILLTAPHGGHEPIPGAAARTKGQLLADEHTGELAVAVAKNLEADLGKGKRPYMVRALFHRKFADANRDEAEAIEDTHARGAYLAYHAAIRTSVDELRRRFPGKGLLIDIHGQAHEPEALLRGTRDGKTVKALVDRAGVAALIGPDSIFGHLAGDGYTVSPTTAPPEPRESRHFDGGFTVATYGSDTANGVDALQLEVGSHWRMDSARRDKLARDLAKAIEAFLHTY